MKPNFIFFLLLMFISLFAQAQTVDFNITTPGGLFCNPQTVTFTQNCTGAPTGFIWDFGNGLDGGNPTETSVYPTAGTYSVRLTALFDNGAISTSKTITVNQTPTVSITSNGAYLCQPGTVNFNANGSAGIASYDWDFGDGSPIQANAGNAISHAYAAYNGYTASVKAATAFGCTATNSFVVRVRKFDISGAITPPNGCIPANATLSVTLSLPPGDNAQSFVWDFGDGSPNFTGAANSTSHTYNITSAISAANVNVTTVQGCTNQFTFPAVAFGTPPFGTTINTGNNLDTFCGSQTITFIGNATNANNYSWNFGDGTSASTPAASVTHKYSTLGNKPVTLTPSFNGCPGVVASKNIFIKGVIASFTYSNTCGNKNIYAFQNTSLGNISHFEWRFSDMPGFIDSVNLNPTHAFPPQGSFTATLNITDNVTGCTDVFVSSLYTAQPSVSRNKLSVCKDSLIVFRVSNTYATAGAYSYEFHVNGAVIQNAGDSTLSYNAALHGNTKDFVIIKDNLNTTCSDTLYLPDSTRVKGPVPVFTAPLLQCADKTFAVANSSYPFIPGENIVKWRWDFGDNTRDSVQNPAPHLYPSSGGTFNIVLTATDVNGCALKTQQTVTANALPRIRSFPAIDTICQNRDTAILRAYTIDTLQWIPATNISCVTCDTTKVYPQNTTEYIAQATNSFGCKSYDTSLVKVYEVINLAVFPSDTTVCPGQLIQYNLNTDGITTWSPSLYLTNPAIKNPIAYPDSSISYTIIVKDSAGCYADTALANIITYPKPTVDAGPDKVVPYASLFGINPQYSADVIKYLWTPVGDLSSTTFANTSGVALKSQLYNIEVTNNNGCKNNDNINIIILCQFSNLLLPSAFTPGTGSVNNYFYPLTRGYKTIKSFIIYNRLGNKVFEKQNFAPNVASLGWNGDIKGDNRGAGTQGFVWYLEAICDQGETVVSKGSVLLIR